MRMRRLLLLAFLALAAPLASVLVASDAEASVSIAVGFDALVKDADSVAIATPVESNSVWEDGRICTYTKLRLEQKIAGDASGETWVRTLGGVVGKIGQLVDGEPVFKTGKSSLVFLRKAKTGATYEVTARAQGQYPIQLDEVTKIRKIVRSANVGVLFPPKGVTPTSDLERAVPGQAQPRSVTQGAGPGAAQTMRLAQDVLHDRPVDEITREVATTWKRLHAAK